MVPVNDENGRSEWSQTSTSWGSAMEHDGRVLEEQPSLRSIYTLESRISRSQRRDYHSSRTTAFCASELLSTSGDGKKTMIVGPGAASNFGYPGTPLVRFSSSWLQPSNNTQIGSPRAEKGVGSNSPAAANSTGADRYPLKFNEITANHLLMLQNWLDRFGYGSSLPASVSFGSHHGQHDVQDTSFEMG